MALPALAGGAAFLSGLKALASSPWVTVGLPTAVSGLMALNDSQGEPGENLASAAGATVGGLSLGGAGLIGGRLMGGRRGAAIGAATGAVLGGMGGGGIGRAGAEILNGNWNDPSRKAIRDAERMARSQMALEAERAQVLLPAQRAQMQLAAEEEARRAALMAQMSGIANYQNALFGAARNTAVPGDPTWGAVLSNIAAGGLS